MDTDKEILETREAAAFLRINEYTLRRLARSGEIPSFKIGASWRFRRTALLGWVRSREGGGRLPLVLVVEPDEKDRRILEERISEAGAEVLLAADGAEALEAARQEQPDLIFLDLLLKDLDAPELLQRLRALLGEVPVVLVSAYPESSRVARAMEAGPVSLLAKPLVEERVRACLRQSLPA